MKISQKLTTGFLGIAVLMGAIGSLAVNLQSEASKNLAIEEAQSVAQTIAYFTEREYGRQLSARKASETLAVSEDFQSYIQLLHNLQKRDIFIVDRNKKILGDANSQEVGKIFNNDPSDEIKKTLHDGVVRTFIETSVDSSSEIKQIVVPLKNQKGEIFGVVILEYTRLYKEALLVSQKSMLFTLVIGCMGSLVALALGYFFSTKILKRIKDLQRAILSIAEGDLDARVDMRSNDEIGELTNCFNKMAHDLKKSHTELVNANQQLLREIVEREQVEAELNQTLTDLQKTQSQLIQTEKMSSLGQLVAGVAHEINNPVNFIHGNLIYVNEYTQNLLDLVSLYQEQFPEAGQKIRDQVETIELEFLIEDLPKMLASMKIGADRIRQIVLSLRNFSRLDEAALKCVDIHEGIDSTLLILQNRLKAKSGQVGIAIVKEYGDLPQVECYAGQLNQVFMNIINNAIDALDEYNQQRTTEEIEANPSTIRICTEVNNINSVVIRIADNGRGMTEEVRSKLFDPFFTTKPIGKGTGLGLSISYQIVVEKHGGKIWCESALGQGTEFIVQIPICSDVTEPTTCFSSVDRR